MKNTIITIIILATTSVTSANECKGYTYDTTRTERQALHQKGYKWQAQQIVRMIEACEAGKIFTPSQTMELHHDNDRILSRVAGDRY